MHNIRCFSFLIGWDGRVYEGRGWDFSPKRFDSGDMLGPINDNYVEIAFIAKNSEFVMSTIIHNLKYLKV